MPFTRAALSTVTSAAVVTSAMAARAIAGLSAICARMVTKVPVSRIRICASVCGPVLTPVVVVMALLCEGTDG
ncbi:hypothetical protein [Corynebacterium variabile]|uniref:hypothetical protein n=1 Tax=Corynebacterium variabile TaxID=1727 RepID=UPI0028A83B58|nr:hypothetical protein [Corynebacterium variabile]